MKNRYKNVATEDSLARIALALEKLAGCTGGIDEQGNRVHEGATCPVHEDEDAGVADAR